MIQVLYGNKLLNLKRANDCWTAGLLDCQTFGGATKKFVYNSVIVCNRVIYHLVLPVILELEL